MARTTRSARTSTGGMAPRKRKSQITEPKPKKHRMVADTSLKGHINRIDDLVWMLQEELRELKAKHWNVINED